MLLFGGGMKRGHLHGVTADERPVPDAEGSRRHRTPARDDVPGALGISPRLAYEIEQRPFYVTRDGQGEPIRSLMA